MKVSHESNTHARGPRVAGFVHIGEIVETFLADLFGEVEGYIEETGGFRGPVRRPQREWSRALDILEHERQENAA
jgi:hypothetical protein